MPDSAIIDPDAIKNLRELGSGDDAFLLEIIGIFLEDTPQRISELDTFLAKQDIEGFGRAAHSIKGSSANLGALALRAAAEKLERHARSTGLSDVTEMITDIQVAFAQTKTALDKIAKKT